MSFQISTLFFVVVAVGPILLAGFCKGELELIGEVDGRSYFAFMDTKMVSIIFII